MIQKYLKRPLKTTGRESTKQYSGQIRKITYTTTNGVSQHVVDNVKSMIESARRSSEILPIGGKIRSKTLNHILRLFWPSGVSRESFGKIIQPRYRSTNQESRVYSSWLPRSWITRVVLYTYYRRRIQGTAMIANRVKDRNHRGSANPAPVLRTSSLHLQPLEVDETYNRRKDVTAAISRGPCRYGHKKRGNILAI